MFDTIKLNKEYWGKKIPKLKYGVPNPLNALSGDNEKFSEAMTSFNISGVFKTTQSGRHRKTQSFLKDQINTLNGAPVVLDIGASDGSTSLDFINLISGRFTKYYVTDCSIECTYCSYKGYTYFFNNKKNCLLVASEKFVFYPVNKTIFNFLFRKSLSTIKNLPRKELLFINKGLQQRQHGDDRIEIRDYDIFMPWPKEKAGIVIVGNLLNRSYFTDEEIAAALKNCYAAMPENGILAIIRNASLENREEIEKSTVYKKNSSNKMFEKIYEINDGVEINDLVLSLKFDMPDAILKSQ